MNPYDNHLKICSTYRYKQIAIMYCTNNWQNEFLYVNVKYQENCAEIKETGTPYRYVSLWK